MGLTKNVNGVEMPLSPEELSDYNQRQSEWETQKYDRAFSEFGQLIGDYIDSVAKSLNFDSTVSLVSYRSSSHEPWAILADKFILWRDNVWIQLIDLYESIRNNQSPVPDYQTVLNGLPPFEA